MAFLEEIMENNESDFRDELKGFDKGGDKGGDLGGDKDYLWCDGEDDYKGDDRDDVKDDDEVSSVALVDEGSRCKMAVRVRDSQSRRRPGGSCIHHVASYSNCCTLLEPHIIFVNRSTQPFLGKEIGHQEVNWMQHMTLKV